MLAVALTGVVGCKVSPRGGNLSRKDETFRIAFPMFGAKVKQGQTEVVELKLDRGSFFRDDVDLEISGAKGITVEPSKVTVKAGDQETVPIKFIAANDAPLGKVEIYVTATPRHGSQTRASFVLGVKEP
jgi:uncharacterized membrane protein